jgi:regulation of enolase protein 1 (concanavalin A-like superfamily)
MMIATPGTKGLAFQRRPFEASASTHTDGGPGGPPVWLRLERSGAQLIASRSADGVTWSEVGRDTITMSGSLYVGLAVTSHDDSAVARAVFDNVLITQGTGAGWRSADIGAVAASGAAAFDGSTAVVMASGADIWGTADEFHYGYQTVHGNFDLVARVTGVQHAHQWTKAGVMVRASTSAGSVHAFLLATPGITKGVAFQRRLVADGTSVHTSGPSLAPAVWLRLSRRDGTITAAYRQSAAESWVTIAQEWMPDLTHSVLAGLAVTSHLDGTVVTASFDNVQIIPVP